MTRLVVDASAWVEYLLRTASGDIVGELIESPAAELHAPALCDVEVAAALRRALMRRPRSINEARALEALDDYFALPIGRHGHQSLLMRMLELRRNFGAYDATYVALAEILRGELVTADGRLAKATRAHSKLTVHGA